MNTKKMFLMLTAAVIFSAVSVPAAKAELLKDYNAGDKLGRGALNLVSSPIEVARTINVQSRVKGPAYGWTAGLVEGLGRFVVRLGTGAIDIVTFPFDFPTNDKSPMIQPEYPWQKWDVEYL